MKKNKQNMLILFLVISLPLIYLANKALIYFIPVEYKTASGALKGDSFVWFASLSSGISIAIAMIVLGFIYRFWISK